MQELSDTQLLAAFAGRGDEAAFREIVARYTDLVYSAAVRQVESSAAAADVAQGVFTDLARKAGTIVHAGNATLPSLAGWLHRATRYAALNHLRDARRRLTNERQAMEQLLTNSESAADWEQIRPVLDEALDSLADEDREALLLRYFKNHDFRAVGLALGVSDDAAQKRVSRAVDRLREFFSKRNISTGASGLVVLISANAVQSAPAGLAAAISAAALLTGTAVTTATAITVTKAIAMTTLQKIFVTATIAVVAGAGAYEAKQAAAARAEAQTLRQQQAPLAAQLQQLQSERDSATNALASLQEELARNRNNNAELLKLRGQSGQTQTALKELAKIKKSSVMPAFMTNAIAQGLSMSEKFKTKAAIAKVDRMKQALQLSDDQAQAISAIMTNNIVSSSRQIFNAMLGGQAPVAAPPDEEPAITALLTPDQLAAYSDFKQAETTLAAKTSAEADLNTINSEMDLSQQQQDKVQAALYQFDLTPASGAPAQGLAGGNYAEVVNSQIENQKKTLEEKINLLQGILTPDQLVTYQQKQMDIIDMQANAMKMFLPVMTNNPAQ